MTTSLNAPSLTPEQAAIVSESCDIAELDPADAMLVYGYFSTQPNLAVDAIWMRGGAVHVATASRFRDASEPADVTVYRMGRTTDGEITFTAVAWMDGTKPFDPAWMDPECSMCRQRHPSDDRHPCE